MGFQVGWWAFISPKYRVGMEGSGGGEAGQGVGGVFRLRGLVIYVEKPDPASVVGAIDDHGVGVVEEVLLISELPPGCSVDGDHGSAPVVVSRVWREDGVAAMGDLYVVSPNPRFLYKEDVVGQADVEKGLHSCSGSVAVVL